MELGSGVVVLSVGPLVLVDDELLCPVSGTWPLELGSVVEGSEEEVEEEDVSADPPIMVACAGEIETHRTATVAVLVH